jgi:hypothetical protein
MSALPWTLFALTLVGLGASLFVGQIEVSIERTDAVNARRALEDMASHLRASDAELARLKATRVEPR